MNSEYVVLIVFVAIATILSIERFQEAGMGTFCKVSVGVDRGHPPVLGSNYFFSSPFDGVHDKYQCVYDTPSVCPPETRGLQDAWDCS